LRYRAQRNTVHALLSSPFFASLGLAGRESRSSFWRVLFTRSNFQMSGLFLSLRSFYIPRTARHD
ncbi:hypothetical protein, partial [Vibrio parahaemolyticus]|uniref:hypothetical protein n=1 Tax=Vibrio parahaemolyticus TaxID=670 RepID=UPI001BAFC5A3